MDNEKRIHRVNKTSNYSVIDNRVLSDKRLSWKARGIMAFILTRPDDWVFYIDELVDWSEKDGEAAFRAGFNELKEAGYIERVPVREGQRIKYWETHVHEQPLNSLLGDFLQVENQDVDSLHVDSLDVENRRLLSTNLLLSTDLLPSTDIQSTKDSVESSTPYSTDFEQWWEVYPKERRRDKQKAFEKWKKAIKETQPGKIIAMTVLYAADKKAIGNNGKYAKMPVTFLNAKTYLDYAERIGDSAGQRHNQTAQHSGSGTDFNRFVTE